MSFGVPFGATTQNQVSPSISGKPASAMVGTSGTDDIRALPVTASARSLPALTSGIAGAIAPHQIGLEGEPKQLADQIGRGAGRRRGEAVLLCIGLDLLDQLLDGVRWHRRI